MKIDASLNIWRPVDELSGRDKGRVYAQRAHYLLGRALADPKQHERIFYKGRIRRKILADDIGCDRSALYDNPSIRSLLEEIEGRSKPRTEACATDMQFALPAKVRSLLSRLEQDCQVPDMRLYDRIILTDQSCIMAGHRYKLPTIILRGKIEQDASDWLRHLVLTNAVETSSATQYAKILRAFLRHCHRKKREWFNVDDQFLVSWRDGRRGKVDDAQIVSDLTIVFQFYVWAETTNLLSLHVGIYEREELPPGFGRGDFPISARRTKSNSVVSRSGWASPLTFRVSKKVEGRRNTPNDNQVMKIHEELLKATHGERDALIAAWAEEAGPRRSEILQLRKSDLPTHEELADLIANEEKWEIRISRRKRRSKAPLSANPYILLQTMDWIESGREDIVSQCRQRLQRYREPDEIFISSTTGKAITPDAVTKIMGEAFKNAGVKKASLHRLRAKAIVEVLEKHVDGFLDLNIVVEPGSQWAETILVRVAEMAGHASPISLRPYLNFVLSRRLSHTEADRISRRGEKARDIERRFATAKSWLEKHEGIITAIKLAHCGKRSEAEDYLRSLLETGELF